MVSRAITRWRRGWAYSRDRGRDRSGSPRGVPLQRGWPGQRARQFVGEVGRSNPWWCWWTWMSEAQDREISMRAPSLSLAGPAIDSCHVTGVSFRDSFRVAAAEENTTHGSELPKLLSGSSVIHVKLGCPLLKLYFHRARYLNRHMHLPGLAIQNSTAYGVRSIGIYISWSSAASRSRRASYAGAGLATPSTFVHFRYFCITERITECRRKETIRR